MRILVPSFGRAGQATTMNMVESAIIVVPESQAEDYEKAYPNRVLSIPDSQDGNIAKKRNACLDLLAEGELCWFLDDDLIAVTLIKHGRVQDVERVLTSHFELMESARAEYGGFAVTSDPVRYLEYQPFSLTKPSYAAMCIRNTGLRYDLELGRHEDADYFLKVQHSGGKIIRDNRYFFEFNCNAKAKKITQKGGIVGSESSHRAALERLRKRWGEVIKIKDGEMNGVKPLRRGP